MVCTYRDFTVFLGLARTFGIRFTLGNIQKQQTTDDSSSRVAAPFLSVVVLAYNEEGNLSSQVSAVLSWFDELKASDYACCPDLLEHRTGPFGEFGELIIVNDGSTDDTGDVADALGKSDARVRVVHHESNKGMGATVRTGYAAATGCFVTQLPGDGQVGPKTLERFLPHLADVDMVLSVYEEREDGAHRKFLSAGFQTMVRLMFRHDPRINGTMIVRRELVEKTPTKTSTFVANLELPFRLMDRGVEHRVVEITAIPRQRGQSKVTNVRRILRVAGELIRLRIRG
ncbi:MAG: hypothetical protein CMH54_15750 [Myxococcales bacterium]|nr:hypothetical protein [Myxococcales bacterium]